MNTDNFKTNAQKQDPHFTLISDPKILSIPVRDILEPMVDSRAHNDILIGPSPEQDNNQNYTFMRYTVYKKLKEAQTRLPNKFRFCLYEAYRSFELQQTLFEKHLTDIKKNYSHLSHTEQFYEACKLCSPAFHLDGSQNIPPHNTGGALDLYLVDHNGEAVDMGIHPKDWMSDIDGSLSLTLSESISLEAKKNRDIMSHALHSVGFVNYPSEYWHWSYGDRYWAYIRHQHYAIYGATTPEAHASQPKRLIDVENT